MRQGFSNINLTGKFTPFRPSGHVGIPDQPVFVTMRDATNDNWCAVFSNVEDLHECMRFCGVRDYKIKVIDHGNDFAQSVLEGGIRLMLDPKIINREKTRWTEIVLDDDSN